LTLRWAIPNAPTSIAIGLRRRIGATGICPGQIQGGTVAWTGEIAVGASHIIHPVGTLRVRWPQRHEHPENDDADCCHQNHVAVSFHYQCLLYIEALMAMLAISMIVPAIT